LVAVVDFSACCRKDGPAVVTAESKQKGPSLLLPVLRLGDAAIGVPSVHDEDDDDEENAGDKAFKRSVEVVLAVCLR
jgi:hypothetical protein